MKLPDDLLHGISGGRPQLMKYGFLLILLSLIGGIAFGIFMLQPPPFLFGCHTCGMG